MNQFLELDIVFFILPSMTNFEKEKYSLIGREEKNPPH
jgi:hypothetical protein